MKWIWERGKERNQSDSYLGFWLELLLQLTEMGESGIGANYMCEIEIKIQCSTH